MRRRRGKRVRHSYGCVLTAVCILAVGCAFGTKARNEALLPAIQTSAVGVQTDALAGVRALDTSEQAAATAQVEAFFASLDSITAQTLTDWVPIASLCEAGFTARIDAGTIGVTVAGSLRERVVRFEAALTKYVGSTR